MGQGLTQTDVAIVGAGLMDDGRGMGDGSGVFAAGEVAGLGCGGYHGPKRARGTFLGGCIFSGRTAGRTA